MRALPDVSSEIYADGASLHAVMDELEYLLLCIHFWSACYNYRNRASIYHLIEVLAPVCLYNLSAKFSGDPAAETEETGIPFFEFPANRSNCHYRHTILFRIINKIAQVQ